MGKVALEMDDTPAPEPCPAETAAPAPAAAEAEPASATEVAVPALQRPREPPMARARRARRELMLRAGSRQLESALRLRYFGQWWRAALGGRRGRQEARIAEIALAASNQLRRVWWDAADALYAERSVERLQRSKQLKEEGNERFKEGAVEAAADLYTEALAAAAARDKQHRSVCLGNRAACWMKQGRYRDCEKDCSDALATQPDNVKWLLRRMSACRALGGDDLYKAEEDAKKVLQLKPTNAEALEAARQLKPLVEARRKQQMDEAMQGLKDLGNKALGFLGLSLKNFQTQQNPDGTYSINFQQNAPA